MIFTPFCCSVDSRRNISDLLLRPLNSMALGGVTFQGCSSRLAGVGVDALGLGQGRGQTLRQLRSGICEHRILQVDLLQADRECLNLFSRSGVWGLCTL